MHNKEKELNDIMKNYDYAVQSVYQKILAQEKNIKNTKRMQIKSLIDKEIMQQVQDNDN
ncbi:MAG: hypothetical protein NC489_20665 [Ruminococcus flavefaciens]|nr:hypothetical protein [Ruminococcus flavefaciens]